MKEITYKVNCPRDFGDVRSMTIRLALNENGTYIPSPCYGCNVADGSANCIHCIKSLFEMSLKDPTMQSYTQPINP